MLNKIDIFPYEYLKCVEFLQDAMKEYNVLLLNY